MSLTDEIRQQCPYCRFEASVKRFATWDKLGKGGLLGKDPDDFLRILCPKCRNVIKYDILANLFLEDDEEADSSPRTEEEIVAESPNDFRTNLDSKNTKVEEVQQEKKPLNQFIIIIVFIAIWYFLRQWL